MLVVRKIEDPAYPMRELISSQQPVGLHDLALAVYPLRLYGVQPRTLLGQKATHDPHPSFAAALLDFSVVSSEPAPHLPGDVPGSVIPDEEQNLLAKSFELLAAPLKKLGRYSAHGPPIHESQPRLIEFGQIESVAGYGLRFGVVFGDRLLNEAKGLSFLAPTAQGGQSHPAPPALVQETHRPGVGICCGHAHQSVAAAFFLSYKGSGEVIHLLALCQRTPRRRA